ncbi:MAG: hypothetical protein ABW223_09010 [Rariglobus sp.]
MLALEPEPVLRFSAMKRLQVLLLSAHLFLIGGLICVYIAPNFHAFGMILIGWFIREMVPYQNTQQSPSTTGRLFQGVVCGLLASWLNRLGLSDFLLKAWHARMDLIPILTCSLVLSYLILSDWNRFLRLTERQIDRFYQDA